MRRRGMTLLELLVAVGIVSILIGLLLVAVVKVRGSAQTVKGINRQRQIVLAIHNYAGMHAGDLGGSKGSMWGPDEGRFPLTRILPLLEAGMLSDGSDDVLNPLAYRSDLDPSFATQIAGRPDVASTSLSSYAVNAKSFCNKSNLNNSFTDGTSQTICISERYSQTANRSNAMSFMGMIIIYPDPYNDYAGRRAASFADQMWEDARPVTTGFPPVSRASVPGVTFQARPPLPASDGRQLQSLQPTGLRVAMMDGSVRTLRPEITETAFWALVTRDAGDIPDPD